MHPCSSREVLILKKACSITKDVSSHLLRRMFHLIRDQLTKLLLKHIYLMVLLLTHILTEILQEKRK